MSRSLLLLSLFVVSFNFLTHSQDAMSNILRSNSLFLDEEESFCYADMHSARDVVQGFGINVASGFTASIKLPPLSGNGVLKGLTFNVNVRTDKRAAVFVADESSKIIFIQSITASYGLNRVMFEKPVILKAGTYYVGYYIHSKAGSYLKPVVFDGKSPISNVSYVSVIDIQPKTLKIGDILLHQDYADKKLGNVMISALVDAPELRNYAIVDKVIGRTNVYPKAKEKLSIRIRNIGTNNVNKVVYKVVHGDEEERFEESINILSGETKEVLFNYEFPNDDSNNTISFSIPTINGSDNHLSNHIYNFRFSILETGNPFPVKNVLIEEFTGEKCGNCPQGAMQVNALVKRLQSEGYEVSVIAHHAGYGIDPFTLEESEFLLPYFYPRKDTFAPALSLNRLPLGDDGYPAMRISTNMSDRFSDLLKGELQYGEIKSIQQDENELVIKGQSLQPDKEMFLSVVITEDAVSPINQNGANDSYKHNNLARLFLTDPLGDKIKFDKDGKFEERLQLPAVVPKEWSLSNLKIVAFASFAGLSDREYSLGKVAFVKTVLSTSLPLSYSKTLQPITIRYIDGRLCVEGDSSSITVYNMQGQIVANKNCSELSDGNYIVVVCLHSSLIAVKVKII